VSNEGKTQANLGGGGNPFRYRYRYHHGAHTQQWVARRRYLVVDLSSGPCEYGVTNAGEACRSRHINSDLSCVNDER